jgi:hypothetical protein
MDRNNSPSPHGPRRRYPATSSPRPAPASSVRCTGHLPAISISLPASAAWADASDNNTIDIAGLPPGQHKVKIEIGKLYAHVSPNYAAVVESYIKARDVAKQSK